MMEQITAALAILGGAAAAVGTVLTSLKKVQEGNYRTLLRRLTAVEQTLKRQDVVVIYLTNWQFDARRLMRLMGNRLVELGIEFTPEMRSIQARLDRELNLDQMEEGQDGN